jgi:hypothetical protein
MNCHICGDKIEMDESITTDFILEGKHICSYCCQQLASMYDEVYGEVD